MLNELKIELSVIIPTFNEVDNVQPLYKALVDVLDGVNWEAVFVDDDSTDGTMASLDKLAHQENNVRRIRRIGRRGLSSAVVEGALSSHAQYYAVIDGDLQHDESKLKAMLEVLRKGDTDLVIGSRYLKEGSFGNWNTGRIRASQFATKLSELVTSQRISDPMSGFFMITRQAFDKAVTKLSQSGYKILLDIVTSYPDEMRIIEIPYQFKSRLSGESKLDSMVMMEFAFMLIEKLTFGIVPARFIMFSLVGATGVLVHFLFLYLLLHNAGYAFVYAQAGATLIAMTSNFFINNWLTYFDKRLKGLQMIQGLLIFYTVCSLGAVANVGVASFVFEKNYTWWLSGLAGVFIGTVWNYAVTSLLAWRK